MATRSWWGWGTDAGAITGDERARLLSRVKTLLPQAELADHQPPELAELGLPAPRIAPPATLAALCSTELADRAAHAHGKAFRDVVRNLLGQLDAVPDLVARPESEQDVVDLLDWCATAGIAVIPYGGGSSVVGGVEPRQLHDAYPGVVTLDLGRLDRVLEVDRTSRAARIQAGVLGPALEDQLRPAGLTLRHFPQSFEFSSLGGWLATRAGGHYATVLTHIDDLTESLRLAVLQSAYAAMASAGVQGVVTCRFTHVYPDGPAPYFGIYASGRWGATVQQWDEIKQAVSEALLGNGGTITHHHAVGRDHRPWYDRQRPDLFAAALDAVKTRLDPAGILNPGVLIDRR